MKYLLDINEISRLLLAWDSLRRNGVIGSVTEVELVFTDSYLPHESTFQLVVGLVF